MKGSMGTGTPALEARGLTLAWGDGDPVVAGIDLVVYPGETVCLVGKSGMGKSTVLHALAGLSRPREGSVILHGRDVTGVPGQVSYMLQKDLLLPNLKVIDNACLPLTLSGMSKKRAREQVRPLLARFGLEQAADKWPSELSGGMRQRAAFLRTYMMGNDVVMLDEPFSALDAITRADMRSWFWGHARNLGLTTLMITHDADEACMMADRVLVLGRVAQGLDAHAPGEQVAHAAGVQDSHVPATIIGEVAPARPAGIDVAQFALTPTFLDAKSRVISLLQE